MAKRQPLKDLIAQPPVWLSYPESQQVLKLLKDAGGEGRFVGGCVRDALLGIVSSDLDICTPLRPEQVLEACKAAGVKALPTGLKHGTVTVIIGARHFEITTLREDVETDGRHARVAFTNDWEIDASRRDFTVNGLYMDASGALYDYYDGFSDLELGLVRFIGDAATRIAEDYLRILRYFRFVARFSLGVIDQASLEACRGQQANLSQLSNERVTREILSLLVVPDPLPALELMAQCEVWQDIFDMPPALPRLQNLLQHVPQNAPDPILRLGALLCADEHPLPQSLKRLRLSSRQQNRLLALESYHGLLSGLNLKATLYKLGQPTFLDQLHLLWADNPSRSDLSEIHSFAKEWEIPTFPVQGKDLLTRGYVPGPEIGARLSDLEAYWIAHDFEPGKAALLALEP